MPGLLPLTGLYGKVPAHGDFVRRGLPSSFVTPWDDWLQAGIARARAGLGAHWADAWDAAPAWRFALPAGACGPDAVAGVMLPSMDTVGRRFPITLAATLPPGAPVPQADWFDALEGAALAGRDGAADADALAAAIPDPVRPGPVPVAFPLPSAGAAAAAPIATEPDGPGPAMPEPPLAPPMAAEDADVLSLLGGPPPHAPAAAAQDGAPVPAMDPEATLALLIGAAPAAADTGPSNDPLLSLLGGGQPATPRESTFAAPGAPEDAVLALLGPAARMAQHRPPAIPDDADLLAGFAAPIAAAHGAADPLAGLAAEGAALRAPSDPGAIPEGEDVLAALSAAPGPETGDGAADAGLPLPSAAAEATGEDRNLLAGLPGLDAEGADPMGAAAPAWQPPEAEDVLAGFAGAAAMPPPGGAAPEPPGGRDDTATAVAAAPPAPDGGGWWTRGAAHVPPMVWAFPGLPVPEHFAYLLEAEA